MVQFKRLLGVLKITLLVLGVTLLGCQKDYFDKIESAKQRLMGSWANVLDYTSFDDEVELRVGYGENTLKDSLVHLYTRYRFFNSAFW